MAGSHAFGVRVITNAGPVRFSAYFLLIDGHVVFPYLFLPQAIVGFTAGLLKLHMLLEYLE